MEGWTREYAAERLQEEGIDPSKEAIDEVMDVAENPDKHRFVPHQNEHIKLMLNVAMNVAPAFAERTWLLGESKRACFVTSDHPVVWHSEPNAMSKYLGVGISNAEEVYFPLDRKLVLSMALPGVLPDGMKMDLVEDNVLFVNSLEASYSYKWVYQHPDDDRIDDLIPKERRALMEINQVLIFED
jgi:hypothetical protein